MSGRVKSIVYSEYRDAEAEDDEEVEEELSTHLNTTNIGPHLKVSENYLRVQYIGPGRFDHDAAAQGNRPVPVRRLFYYFEMTVEDSGPWGTAAIGFTDEHFSANRQPGWDPNTFGYHGDDGKIFHDSGLGIPFGPTYTTGDTVGAGINNASQDVFFTRNGEFIGSIAKDFQGTYFLLLVLIAQMSGSLSILGQIISSLIFSNWPKTCFNKFGTYTN